MAGLLGKSIPSTYKDLLTVHGSTSNQGLETGLKQVFDGEGVGSPLYLGTSTLDIQGNTTITGNLAITGNLSYTGTITGAGLSGSTITGTTITGTDVIGGNVISSNYKMGSTALNAVVGFTWDQAKSEIKVEQDLITKGKMTFSKTNYDDLVISAETGTLEKGDGTKGKVSLGDTKVSLKKGDTELLSVEEDGTLRMQSVSSEPSSPSSGDMVNIDGKLYINQ